MTTRKASIICYGILFLAVLLFLAVSIFFGLRKHQEGIHAVEEKEVMMENPVTVLSICRLTLDKGESD